MTDWGILEDIRRSAGDHIEVPPDAFTVKQYAERFKVPLSSAQKELKRRIEAGLIERTNRPRGQENQYWLSPKGLELAGVKSKAAVSKPHARGNRV